MGSQVGTGIAGAGQSSGDGAEDAEAASQRAVQRSGQLHHWGVVIGMVLANNLAAERSAALGGLSGGSVVRLDQFRHQFGGVGPGQNPLIDF